MPSKAHTAQRRGRVVHNRHRLQIERARVSLSPPPLSPPRRLLAVSQVEIAAAGRSNNALAGPSNQPFHNAMAGPSNYLAPVLYTPLSSTGSFYTDRSSGSSGFSGTASIYTNGSYPTPTISPMDLDAQSNSSTIHPMSIASDGGRSDGSSTVVPMQGIANHYAQAPPVAYWATPNDLDNLRNAIHFMHHATTLVSNTYNALLAQNPHCHRFPPA